MSVNQQTQISRVKEAEIDEKKWWRKTWLSTKRTNLSYTTASKKSRKPKDFMLIKEFAVFEEKSHAEENLNLICVFLFSFSLFLLLLRSWWCCDKGDRLLDIPCKVCGDRSSGNYRLSALICSWFAQLIFFTFSSSHQESTTGFTAVMVSSISIS